MLLWQLYDIIIERSNLFHVKQSLLFKEYHIPQKAIFLYFYFCITFLPYKVYSIKILSAVFIDFALFQLSFLHFYGIMIKDRINLARSQPKPGKQVKTSQNPTSTKRKGRISPFRKSAAITRSQTSKPSEGRFQSAK